MFTGIIQHLGKVTHVRERGPARELHIDLGSLADRVQPGGSVSVNGVCLTATTLGGQVAAFDVVAETVQKSNLGRVSVGQSVNLELPLRASDAIDGHFVLGHVDGLARLEQRTVTQGEHVIWLSVPEDLAKYIVPKGSVALDGVSLTIAEVSDQRFSVAIIPTTARQTTLGMRNPGDLLNLETDYLARIVLRYVGRFAASGDRSLLEKLKSAGFVQ